MRKIWKFLLHVITKWKEIDAFYDDVNVAFRITLQSKITDEKYEKSHSLSFSLFYVEA